MNNRMFENERLSAESIYGARTIFSFSRGKNARVSQYYKNGGQRLNNLPKVSTNLT